MPLLCQSCGVGVARHTNCPLCGKYVSDTEIPSPYPPAKRSRTLREIMRIPLFVFICVSVISLLLDFLTITALSWSPWVIAGTSSVWLLIMRPIYHHRNFCSLVLHSVLWCSFCLIVIDFMTGWIGWSLSYTVPPLIIAGMIAIIIFALKRHHRWSETSSYLIALLCMDILIMILRAFDLHPNMSIALIALVFGLLVLLGMKFFVNKILMSELNKRFHL